MQAWRKRERPSSCSSFSMGAGFDDWIRRRASSKLPHLQRDFRVELNVVVLCLWVFVALGVEVALLFVLTVMVVGREMGRSIMQTDTEEGIVCFLRLVLKLQ